MIAFTVMLAFTGIVSSTADAKRGGIKSPRQGYTQAPKKSTDNVQRSDANKNTGAAAGTGAAAKPGFFSGGGLMKGLMIGGLAGMLFGGMFGGMGFMGEILGLMVNLLALFALVMVVVALFTYVRRKRKPEPDTRRPY